MPSQVTDWGAEQWLGVLFGLVEPPASYWVALASSEPGTGADGTILADLEPSGSAIGDTGYSRVEVAADDTAWADSGSGYISNLNALSFATPTVDWGTIPYIVLCDAETLGHIYCYGRIVDARTMPAGYLVRVPSGAIALRASSLNASIVS